MITPPDMLPPDAPQSSAPTQGTERTAWQWLGYLLDTRPMAFWGSVWVSVVLVALVAVGSLLSPSAAERRSVSAIALGSDSGVVTQPAENRGKMPLWVFGAIVFSCTAGSIFVSRQLQATTAPLPPTARSPKRARRSPQGTVTSPMAASPAPAIGDTTFAPLSTATAQAESPRPFWKKRPAKRTQPNSKSPNTKRVKPRTNHATANTKVAPTQPAQRRRRSPAPGSTRPSLISAVLSPWQPHPRQRPQRPIKSRGKAGKARPPKRLAPYSPHEPLLARQGTPAIAPPTPPTAAIAPSPVARTAPYTMPPVMRSGDAPAGALQLPNPSAPAPPPSTAIAPAVPSFVIATKPNQTRSATDS